LNRKEMQLGREAGKTEARSKKREVGSKKQDAGSKSQQEIKNKKQETKNKTTAALRPGLDVQAYQPTDRRAICAQTSNKGRVKVADDLKWRSKNGSDHCTGCQQR
jgi:hypothetical protein